MRSAYGPLLSEAARRAIAYLDGLDARPVFPGAVDISRLEAALTASLPDAPCDPAEVLEFLDSTASLATVANAGGRYFGFVTGGALPVTVAASWLATAWDQNAFGHASSPAAALLEAAALRWLIEALDLPGAAEGALVTGATMANFTCLAAARHQVLAEAGWDVEAEGLTGAPPVTVILGEQAHATIYKVLGLLGFGRRRVVTVPVDGQGRMRADAVPRIAGPAILCLQAGNVNSGGFDPAADIIPAARAAGAWVHVDGAFGLWARACPELAALAEGYGAADSWATDAHKWLNVPYDCGVALVRDAAALRGAMSISGAYLLQGRRRDAIDVTPDSSRRARAVEVWAALKSLGRRGLADLIGRNAAQARRLADALEAAGVEVLNDVVLNQVVAAFGPDTVTDKVVAALQAGGTAWCGGTEWRGRRAMRISVSSWATTDADIDRTLAAILLAREAGLGVVGADP